MGNLDLIVLTIIVSVLYIGFAVALFSVQKNKQNPKQ